MSDGADPPCPYLVSTHAGAEPRDRSRATKSASHGANSESPCESASADPRALAHALQSIARPRVSRCIEQAAPSSHRVYRATEIQSAHRQRGRPAECRKRDRPRGPYLPPARELQGVDHGVTVSQAGPIDVRDDAVASVLYCYRGPSTPGRQSRRDRDVSRGLDQSRGHSRAHLQRRPGCQAPPVIVISVQIHGQETHSWPIRMPAPCAAS